MFQFFEEVKQVEQWLNQQAELLNTRFSQHTVKPEEAEKLIRDVQVSWRLTGYLNQIVWSFHNLALN